MPLLIHFGKTGKKFRFFHTGNKGPVGQRAAKLLAIKVRILKRNLPPLQAHIAQVQVGLGLNHSQSLTDSIFAALWSYLSSLLMSSLGMYFVALLFHKLRKLSKNSNLPFGQGIFHHQMWQCRIVVLPTLRYKTSNVLNFVGFDDERGLLRSIWSAKKFKSFGLGFFQTLGLIFHEWWNRGITQCKILKYQAITPWIKDKITCLSSSIN